jgi:hypothetical protein
MIVLDAQTSDHFRARVADLVDELAEATGDSRFARAAGVLRGKQGGRPETDDAKALDFAKDLLTSGAARSINDACVKAATILFSPTDIKIDATIQRLSRKLRKVSDINSYD